MAERNTVTIDDKIKRAQDEVVKAKEKYDSKVPFTFREVFKVPTRHEHAMI